MADCIAMYRPITLLLLSAALLAGCTDDRPPPGDVVTPADLILTNARVYTLAWPDPDPHGQLSPRAPRRRGWAPDAQAVAIRDGEIVFVGSHREAARWRGEQTRARDLAGATVVPGLADAHTHLFQLGLSLNRVNLYDVETEEEAVARIAERARDVPPGEWIVGQGWDEGRWADNYPDKRLLSEAVPDHPVFMRSLHSFAGWCNQAALDIAGINAETEEPVGGVISRDEAGDPDGLFLNRAVPLIEDAIPEPTSEQLSQYWLDGMSQMARDGYVAVHEAGLNSREMAVLEALDDSGELPLRVYAMLSIRDEQLARDWLSRGADTDPESMLVTRSVKAFYDGALGSRGALLLEEYSDRPGHLGVGGHNYGFDPDLAAQLMRAGFQVNIHAIGDGGNREALAFLDDVGKEYPATRQLRHRLEHAQVLNPADMPLLHELGVIASMQPPHAVEDKAWAEQRLGPERVRGAYAWRALRRQGALLVFSADNPGSDHSVFYGIHAALTRKDKAGEPEGGWYPAQALNIDETLRAYTRWSAYASFREDRTGMIAAGRWADLTVMDIDPFVLSETDPGAILDGNILMTVVAGRIVYER